MSKGNTTENDMLKAVLKGVDPAWRTNPNRFLSLHTSDPGEGGTQETSETPFEGYTRIPVPLADWTDGGSTFTNATLLQFPKCTGGAASVVSHLVIGTLVTGAGQILYSGPLSDTLSIANQIQAQFSAGSIEVTED